MRFYYFSIIGTFLALAASGVLVTAFWLVWTKLAGRKLTTRVVAVSIPVALLLPWTEEFWIAWNFGQLCRKDAGLFVSKTVEVDGFYDSTTAWGPRQLSEGGYRFVESRDNVYGRFARVERADAEARDRALQWYSTQNPGKERPKDLFIQHRVSETEQISVSPNGVDAWRTTKIDKPTARYHYTFPHQNSPTGHKLSKIERVVLDSQTGELLARETKYSRTAHWLFFSLGSPVMLCPAPGERPHEERGSIFLLVLKPSGAEHRGAR